MKKIIISIPALAFCLLLQACYENTLKEKTIVYPVTYKMEMINADNAFSNMSRRNGMKKAFIEFMDNDGILLRPNHMPIIGADAIEYLSQQNDASYTLTWTPSAAEISYSGDLGFTYGTYLLHVKDTAFSGTYVTIWKKQADGKWKFILDSGNEGTRADTVK